MKKSKKIEEISFNSCFSQREKQKTKHAANQDHAGMKTGTEGIAVAQAGAHNRTLLSWSSKKHCNRGDRQVSEDKEEAKSLEQQPIAFSIPLRKEWKLCHTLALK